MEQINIFMQLFEFFNESIQQMLVKIIQYVLRFYIKTIFFYLLVTTIVLAKHQSCYLNNLNATWSAGIIIIDYEMVLRLNIIYYTSTEVFLFLSLKKTRNSEKGFCHKKGN